MEESIYSQPRAMICALPVKLHDYRIDMSFDDLMSAWGWKPIRNCPGRFVLDKAASNLSLDELVGEDIEVNEFHVEAAKDTVLVACLNQGGVISYRRADGSLIHTLNTAEGFERKLRQLGINFSDKTTIADFTY